MTDKDFTEQAAIAAMQGMLSRSGISISSIEISKQAVLCAEDLLHSLKGREYSTEENDINQYIMEVDETHGKKEIELQHRIDDLEYIVSNLKRIVEAQPNIWVNKPDDRRGEMEGECFNCQLVKQDFGK